MAIAFDACTDNGTTWASNATSVSFNHTCTGSNLLLVVSVRIYDAAARTVSGITYNGVALTLINRVQATVESANQTGELWYLIAPATGANSLVVTYSAEVDFTTVTAASYTGVHQTSPIDSNATESLTSASSTNAIATTVVGSGCWLVCSVMARDGTVSAGASTTMRDSLGTSATGYGDSNDVVGTGSQSLNFAASSSTWPVNNIASIAPVAGTNLQVNIGDSWKVVASAQINIGDVWKPVAGIKINIGDSWKTVL